MRARSREPVSTGQRPRQFGAAIAAAAGFAVPVAVLALVVRSQQEWLLRLDVSAIRQATDVTRADPPLRSFLIGWQEAFQPRWVYLVCGLLSVVVAVRRPDLRTRVVWAICVMLACWGLTNVVKLIVQRVRPIVEDPVATAPGYSFPSGHASNCAAAGTAVVILLWPLLGRRGRVSAVAGAVTLTVVTALDRVFLGVHYPSDVIAGAVLGSGMVIAGFLGYRRTRWGG